MQEFGAEHLVELELRLSFECGLTCRLTCGLAFRHTRRVWFDEPRTGETNRNGAGVALAISKHNPVGFDVENPQLVYAQRALDAEVGSMLFVSLAFGLFSSLYLAARSRRWYRVSHALRLRDASLVGLLNIVGIILQSVLAYLIGRAHQGPTLGIMLHLIAAVAANASVYERRFRQLGG